MIDNATQDGDRAQLLKMLNRAARLFAKGYCKALKDLKYSDHEQNVAQMVMLHVEHVMEQLADQFGVEWSMEEHNTILLTIRDVCIKDFMPF